MIRLIAAIDSNGGIARSGTVPWEIPDDLKHFKHLTTQHGATVLMGRKTYESIGQPLPGRRNLVLTSRPIENVETVNSLKMLDWLNDVWIIGGERVYSQTIGRADELYLTTIEGDFGCDQFFPAYEADFKLIQRSNPQKQNDYTFYYEIWKRT